MNTRVQILGTLLLLTACDFDPKDIGDPSGDTIDSSGAAEASTSGYATDGPNSTSQGGSDTSNGSSTGLDTSTTGADPTVGSSTTGADPTVSTTTGPDPTVGSSTSGDPTGDPSTSMGDTSTSTTGDDSTSMGATGTGTTDVEMTSTSTTGEQPGPVACDANPPTFPIFDKQCASKADCTVVAHTIDCCGSERLIGINEGAVVEFNQAEQVCDEQLPQCDCLANPPVAEDGNSVLNPEEASLACNNNQCETFVF